MKLYFCINIVVITLLLILAGWLKIQLLRVSRFDSALFDVDTKPQLLFGSCFAIVALVLGGGAVSAPVLTQDLLLEPGFFFLKQRFFFGSVSVELINSQLNLWFI